MDTESYEKESGSASPIPASVQTTEVQIKDVTTGQGESTAESPEVVYGKEVVVRDAAVQRVTVRIHIEREVARYENLVANRGRIETETSTSQGE